MTDQETAIESTSPTETTQSKKRIRGKAIDRLARAIARSVRDRSTEISDALVNRALEGDVSCAKLLVTLIEKLPPPQRKFRSIALEWANSPAWKDPNDNADAGGEPDNEAMTPEDFQRILERCSDNRNS